MPILTTNAQPKTPKAAARRRDAVDKAIDTAMFRALADPTRARIFACLVKCPRSCSVTEVAECCAVDFSVVARHLAALAKAGLLESEKRGRTALYAARHHDVVSRFRGLADAIEAWAAAPDESPGGCCLPGCCTGSPAKEHPR